MVLSKYTDISSEELQRLIDTIHVPMNIDDILKLARVYPNTENRTAFLCGKIALMKQLGLEKP